MKPSGYRQLLPTCGLMLLMLWGMAGPSVQGAEPALPELESRRAKLVKQNDELAASWTDPDARHGVSYDVNGELAWSDAADLGVYPKALEWMLRHNEVGPKSTLTQAVKLLEAGEQLVAQIKQDGTRTYREGSQICGYVSAVDHSLQPYVVSLPKGFPLDRSRLKRYPLYVVLHGRGTQNEVGFIARHLNKGPADNQQWIQLDVFGRVDNAYRWAGETDVFEAIKDVSRRFAVDDSRITLWGFSMGGAGAWHLATHHPSRWASAGAGAGFIDFYEYQNQAEKLPEPQDRALRIYDSILYARNLANIDFITYGGELDKQIVSSQRMVAAAKESGIDIPFVIGKGAGHKFTPEGAAEFQAFLWKHNQQGLPRYPGPRELQFVTYTPKYGDCFWLKVEELDRTYDKATVASKYSPETGTMQLETQNVAVLAISRDIADDIEIDGEPALPLREAADGLLPQVYFQKFDAGWEVLNYDESRDYQENGSGRKCKDLQGPIDDAFMQPFVCVKGTGTPWSPEHQAWADWTLNRFEREFDKWMRGKIRIVNDTDVTPDMIARYHLILFGDPGSNSLIARVHDEIPLEWTAAEYRVGDATYPTSQHGVAVISPNPLNPRKYVVLNSGMTTHEKDFKASNAWLFPKLGDLAVLQFAPEKQGFAETITFSTLLDDNWNLPEAE